MVSETDAFWLIKNDSAKETSPLLPSYKVSLQWLSSLQSVYLLSLPKGQRISLCPGCCFSSLSK